MAEVAMNALGRNPREIPQIGVERGGGRMAGIAHPDAVRVLVAQAPAGMRPALPVGAVIEIEKSAIRRRAGVSARRPFVKNFLMAIAAILMLSRIWRRVNPGVTFAVLRRQALQFERQRRIIGYHAFNEETFHGCRDALPIGIGCQLKSAFSIRENEMRTSLI